MTLWIWLALASYFIWAFVNLIDKVLISKYLKDPLALNLIALLIGSLLTIFYIVIFKEISFLPWILLLIISAAGAIRVLSYWSYYEATKKEEISRVTMLWQTSPIFTLVLAYFLINERLDLHQLGAFFLLLSAGFIASIKFAKKSIKFSSAYWFMLVAAFTIALSYVLIKFGYGRGDFWSIIFWVTIGEILGIVIVASIFKKNPWQSFLILGKKGAALLTTAEIISVTAFILNVTALAIGPAVIISALSATGPLFVFLLALLGTIFLPKLIKEEMSAKVIITKIIALLFISGGLILLAIK